jgi:hypothetical protein
MEAISLTALGVLLVAIAWILVSHLADKERAGKRFFWTEASLPEAELKDFLPKGVGVAQAV